MNEEEIIKNIKEMIQWSDHNTYKIALQEILDLYNNEKEKNKELNKENLEIRDWKYVIDSPIDLDKLKELDLIKIKGKEYVSKDKIKAKIEEVKQDEDFYREQDRMYEYEGKLNLLQSLLEKE